MIEVSLSFAATAVNDNIGLLLLILCLVAVALLILTGATMATFVVIGLYTSRTPAAVEKSAHEK